MAFPWKVGFLGRSSAHVPDPPIVVEENVRIDAWFCALCWLLAQESGWTYPLGNCYNSPGQISAC